MTALATVADVEDRLGRPLTAQETSRADPGLLDEASDLIVGFLGADPSAGDDAVVPAPVARVAARMVARVLEQSATSGGVFGATSMTDQIGDFSQTRAFQPGSTTGGPWLSGSDKAVLKAFRSEAGAFAVDTTAAGAWHAPVCALAFGADWCSCGADLTLAGPLWEG